MVFLIDPQLNWGFYNAFSASKKTLFRVLSPEQRDECLYENRPSQHSAAPISFKKVLRNKPMFPRGDHIYIISVKCQAVKHF